MKKIIKNLIGNIRKLIARSVFLVVLSIQLVSLSVLSANKMAPTEENTNLVQEAVIQKINLPSQFVVIAPETADLTIGYRNGNGEAWRVSADKTRLTHSVAGKKPGSFQWKTIIARDSQGNVINSLKNIQISVDGGILLLQDNVSNLYRYDWDKLYFIKLYTGNAYTHNAKKNTFVKTKNPLLLDSLSIGNSHTVWAMDSKRNIIYQLDEKTGAWHPRANGISVSTGTDGTVVIIDTKGAAHMHAGDNIWHALPGAVLEKIVCCSKDYIYGISQGNLWRYDSTKKSWEQVMDAYNKPVNGVKNIGINPIGAISLTSYDGTVYSNGKQVVSIHEHAIKAAKIRKLKQQKQQTKTPAPPAINTNNR